MTPEQLAREQREFLIRTEKQSAILMLAEFDALKRQISNYLIKNAAEIEAKELSSIERVLDEISEKVDILSFSASSNVTRAQHKVIKFASESLQRFLPEISTSIFETDKQAIQKLIGRTQNGSSLEKFFQRLKEPIREKAKAELIEGFTLGESNQLIAKRIRDVADIGYSRALTISRTEANETYRAASRDFYREAGIQEYIWMSVLDVRTCLICWNLHGRKFKSSKKVFSHPNCRCALIPLTENQKPIITGAERFSNLEIGYQKQILGAKRFEMFQSGEFALNDFVESKLHKEFGDKFIITPLSEFEKENL